MKQPGTEQLEKDIEMEQMDYDICEENPTYTAQFTRGQLKHAEKIRGMKQKLKELKHE